MSGIGRFLENLEAHTSAKEGTVDLFELAQQLAVTVHQPQ
jgi:hypothetical protein